MKLRFFGKEAEIRTEVVVIGISVLALLGMLIGYVFFRDTGDIIIEAGAEGSAANKIASADTEHLTDAGKQQAGVKSGNDNADDSGSRVSTPSGSTSELVDKQDGTPGGGTSDGSISGVGASGPNAADNEEGKIKIYVVGCVNKPGIVTLKKGSMICDAVSQAGGLTEDADRDNINMVYSLNENVMLYIKSKKDESNGLGKGAVIVSDSGTGAEVIGKGDDQAGTDRSILVNINTAGVDELDTLPGIGEATARDIIAYRDKFGGFGIIEDIMKVPRIKDNRFEGIRDYITVE